MTAWWMLAALLWAPRLLGSVALRVPPTLLVEGLAVAGCTKSRDSLDLYTSLDAMRRAGVMIAEIHAGQSLGTNAVDSTSTVGEGMTEDQVQTLRSRMNATGMRFAAVRVRFANNASAITRTFEWADKLGVQVLIGDPPREQFDHVEKMIRLYNIGVALPTATAVAGSVGGAAGGPARAGWSQPKEIMPLLRGRDPRFGVIVNVLNLARGGVDPFQALEEVRTRLVGVQLVDLSETSPRARPVPFGTGTFDFRRLLSLLDSQRFDGYLTFESPSDEPEFEGDLSKGLEFFRREMRAIKHANTLRLASRSVTVTSGLSYEVLVQGEIPEPVRVQACPDGSIWFASRRGHLWQWSESVRTQQVVARFPVSVTGQRGLYSFAFDPGFATNGFVFVFQAPLLPSGNSNRVSRYTAVRRETGWSIAMDTERVLLEIPSADHGVQQGGGFLVHPRDGLLYVGTGDDNRPEETPRFFDDPTNAPQNLADLRGKILRLGRDGSIPAGNPFVGRTNARPEIFAYGLRNPFSLVYDEAGDRVLVGDVGWNRRQDAEEVNVLQSGVNYGWPRCSGANRDTLSGAACPLPDAVEPWFTYPHESAATVVVGPYLGDTPPPGWPARFRQGLIYADYSRRVLRFAPADPDRAAVTNSVPLASGFAGGPLSLTLTPSGTLYLVEYAGYLAGSPQDRLSRIVPKPSTGTRPRTGAAR